MNLNWTKKLNRYKLFIFFISSLQIIFAKSSDIIKGPPILLSDRTSQQKSVNEGKDIKFSCPIGGSPEPIYEWFKDNNPIPGDSWERFRIQKSTLKIKQVIPEDRGTYTCKGVNGFGSEQFTFYLHIQASLGNVLSSPTGDELKVDQVFPLSGSSITKLPGQSVRFKCFVTGDPEPDITWYKNGRLLNPSNFHPDEPMEYETVRGSKYFLHIPHLSSWDSANYTCEAMNIHGAITVNWTLHVVAKIPQEKPEAFPLQLSNLSAVSGEEAVLRCRGTWDSEISPKVKWLRQIDPLQLYKIPENETFSYKGKYYQVLQPTELLVLEDGYFLTKLVIRKSSLHDSGIYVCTATNRYGLNFKEASLSVVEVDSNMGHLILVVSLSLVVFIIVALVVIVTVQRKRAKRLPPQHSSSLVTEPSKVQMEPYGRPLLPPPLVSDHGELQPRYVVYPPTISPQSRPPEDQNKAPSGIFEGSARLHPNMGHLGPHPPQSSDGSNQGQPIIVYQDAPRSMYVSANRYHLQNFDVI